MNTHGPRPVLPRPDVTADIQNTPTGKSVDVVISRDNKAHSFRGEAATSDGAVKDVVEKILADHRTAEYIKEG